MVLLHHAPTNTVGGRPYRYDGTVRGMLGWRLGRLLAREMRDRGLSLRMAARLLDTNHPNVVRWANGLMPVAQASWPRLAAVFGWDLLTLEHELLDELAAAQMRRARAIDRRVCRLACVACGERWEVPVPHVVATWPHMQRCRRCQSTIVEGVTVEP